MEPIRCANCGKELTDKTEVEYSEWLTSYFCSPDCAADKYFDLMGSAPVDFSELPDTIKVVDGKLCEEIRMLVGI